MILDTKGKKKLAILMGGIAIIATFVLIAILPKAIITITLKKELFKKTYPFTFDFALQKSLPEINRINAIDIKKILPHEKGDAYILLQKIGAAIPKKSIEHFLTEKINSEINLKALEIDKKSLRYTITMNESAQYSGEIYSEVSVVPKIDQNALARAIAGKKIDAARVYLNSIPNFAAVSIQLRPHFLFFIPFITKRVYIVAD